MKYYRYQETYWSDHQVSLTLHEYEVVKETPCGVKIELWTYGRERFINKYSKKKFACATKEEALISYHARKKRQVQILKAQLRRAEAALSLNPNQQCFFSEELTID